jgi:hypothetical protein
MDNKSSIINKNEVESSSVSTCVSNISLITTQPPKPEPEPEPKQAHTSKFFKRSTASKLSESSSNYTGLSNMSIMSLKINNTQQNSSSSDSSSDSSSSASSDSSSSSSSSSSSDSSSDSSCVSSSQNDIHINKKIIIDVAVLCQEYVNIDIACNDNVINLDEIEITTEIFQSIFYPYGDNFGINKDFVCNNTEMLPYISIHLDYRTIMQKKFFLLEELIANIERDLNIPRTCFTKESLIELTHEISCIKTLCDINSCSVLSSLSWANISEIINSYRVVKTCRCNHNCECKKYDN